MYGGVCFPHIAHWLTPHSGLFTCCCTFGCGANQCLIRGIRSISKSQLEEILTLKRKNKNLTKSISPGLSNSHYKPDTKVRINATKPNKNEAWLAFGEIPKHFNGVALTLSKRKCLKESAKNLYGMLRFLDKQNVNKIAVQKIPNSGLGIAINDRLRRASYCK